MTPVEPVRPLVTVTGSRRIDLPILGVLVLVVLVFAPRVRVYHRITVLDVQVERLDPDQTTHALSTPRSIRARRLLLTTPDDALTSVSDQIRQYMRTAPMARDAPPGARFRWTIRYGDNSPRLDREMEIVIEP